MTPCKAQQLKQHLNFRTKMDLRSEDKMKYNYKHIHAYYNRRNNVTKANAVVTLKNFTGYL
jgi:transposase